MVSISNNGGIIGPIKTSLPIRNNFNEYLFNKGNDSNFKSFKTNIASIPHNRSMNRIAYDYNLNTKLIQKHVQKHNFTEDSCFPSVYPLQRAKFLKIDAGTSIFKRNEQNNQNINNLIFNNIMTEGLEKSFQRIELEKNFKTNNNSINFQTFRKFSTKSNEELKKSINEKLSTTDSSYFSSASTSSFDETIEIDPKKHRERLTHSQSWPLQIRSMALIERRGFLQKIYEMFKMATLLAAQNDFNLHAELFWLKSKILHHWSMKWIFNLQVKNNIKKFKINRQLKKALFLILKHFFCLFILKIYGKKCYN